MKKMEAENLWRSGGRLYLGGRNPSGQFDGGNSGHRAWWNGMKHGEAHFRYDNRNFWIRPALEV
jgi:hypothetical protein